MASHKVGGEVDAFCTRCKMTLAHTILAMMGAKIARVKCNTCGGDHAFRSAPGSTSTTARKPRAGGAATKAIIGWQQRVDEKGISNAKKYSVRQSFALDDLIEHPTFGLGLVSAVRADKIDVAFKGEQKTLVHGKGEGPVQTEKPKYSPPSSARSGPADKPVIEGEAAQAEEEPTAEASDPAAG